MTLMEMLIAITLLATLTGLLSSLWGQLGDWARQNQFAGESLEIQRAIGFLDEQWGSRRAVLRVGEEGKNSWDVTPEELQFVTSTPALFPDWPLVAVRVTFEIEDSLRRTADGRQFAKLLYEETRLIDMSTMPDQPRDALGRDMSSRITLLDDCVELRFEQLDLRSAARARARGLADEEELSPWRPVEARSLLHEALREEEDEVALPRAIRIRGERRGEEFACELIAEASR